MQVYEFFLYPWNFSHRILQVSQEKSEDIEERLREDLPVLIERNDDKVRPIISDNPDAPNHLIIEGDNLAALTELSYTHAGKVDVIYIDPPYNTGNTDRDGGFVYNDSFVGSDDDYKHSKWLSFINTSVIFWKFVNGSEEPSV